MARSPIAIQDGFLYQAYYFWLKAARLFKSQSKVKLVGYEINGYKAFDDVHVEYNEPERCGRGEKIERDFFQLKFHVDHNGSIGYEDLIDPEFIGAKKVSFLQRLQTLCSSNHDFAKISRFQLYTPWVINPDDPLAELVSNNEGEIRFDKLGTGGPASKFGKVREAWKNHLKLSTDAELYDILRPLRIRRGEDLQRLRQLVSERLENVGLKPIDFSKTTDEYPGLIFRLSKEGRDTFTREQLLEELKRDGLVVSPQPSKSTVKQFAIRSFFRAYDFLEDDSDRILALETAHFEGRFILDPALWNKDIRDEIVNFANANFIQKNSPMDLHLDVHSSLAIAIGSLVSLKSMVDVAPVQKFNFKDHVWRVSDQPAPTENLRAESVTCSSGPDVAVLINITRSTTEDVKKYIVAELPDVGELLVLEPQDGSGQHAIRDADHAWKIAEQVSAKLSAIRSRVGNKPSIHIFNSAPNGLLFFIGRMASPAGTLKIYEFDFEKKRHGSYELSVILPWK